MNTGNNQVIATEGAPLMPVAEIAPKTIKRKGSKKPAVAGNVTIARRKVLAGQHKITGAPKLPVLGLTKNPRKGPFTLMDIFKQNGETISLLTIKKRKNELRDAGTLVLDSMAAKQQHLGTGRPPEYFNFDLTQGTVKIKRAKSGKTRKAKTTKSEAPIVVNEPDQAPIAEQPAPAPAEQAAEPAIA